MLTEKEIKIIDEIVKNAGLRTGLTHYKFKIEIRCAESKKRLKGLKFK